MSNYSNSAQARVAATGLSTGGLRGGAGNRPVICVEPGDRVSHDAFGLGTVVEVTGAGDKAQATVDFGSGGTKRLVLRYAPLVKLLRKDLAAAPRRWSARLAAVPCSEAGVSRP